MIRRSPTAGWSSRSSPAETGSSHPLAGVHYQQRVERLAYLAGGRDRTQRRSSGPATSSPGGRAAASSPPAIAAGDSTIDLGAFLPALVVEALVRGLPKMDRRFGGRFLARRDPYRPRVARQLAGPHPPRSGRPGRARASRGSTPAAKGPATPAESSARLSMGCELPDNSWRPMQNRPDSKVSRQPCEGLADQVSKTDYRPEGVTWIWNCPTS